MASPLANTPPWPQLEGRDKIVVTIPLQLRTESTDDRKDIQTLFYGHGAQRAQPIFKFIQRGFYERNGLDGTIKLGVQKKEGTKNYFIIDGDEFEPAYNGDNTPYHMYFSARTSMWASQASSPMC